MPQEFQFGEFTLDQAGYRLQRGDRVLRLEKLPMELLILLVERRGELVSRDEIAERLWGKDVFVDIEHSINTAVRKVRQVLRDDPEKPRFVETVVGKGYRFAAPVTCTNGGSSQQIQATSLSHAGAVSSAGAELTKEVNPKKSAVRVAAMVGVLAVLALGAIALVLNRGSHAKNSSEPPITSIAVLPLRNLSGNPEQEYFADGMTEELIGRLANIHGLRVISRTSAMRFKDTRQPIPEIARALHVDALLEGSVIREGDRVRVNAQLIRGATDEHIWAEEYQREYRNILTLQEELAKTIAQKIKVSLTPEEQAGLSIAVAVDPEVHESYLKGRYYLNQRTEDALRRSIGYFQQSIDKDPNYALGYCGLADAYALLGFRGRVPSQQSLSQAKAAALRAIALDSTLADAHASLGFLAETHEWDWATAAREYKRALELNPNDARTHNWYAGYLTYVGRLDEGIEEAKRARDLDPLSLPINNALAGRLLVAGRYSEALQQVRATLDLDSHFAAAHQTLGWAYLNTGKKQDAIGEFQQAVALSGKDDADFLLDLGFGYASAGNRDEARRILIKLKEMNQRGLAPSGSVGILYGALGDANQAFAWLDKAYQERDPELTYIKVPNRRFEPLREDARFRQLVRRVGLPQ
jgi:TolB-like protein/DNA-binding winged helix-turn-helix (wHTH) protein/Flp pilus assembly protein TadD